MQHYKQAISDALTRLGLQHRCSYVFDHWLQVYGEDNVGHGAHDHFSNRTILSWVHFLNPSDKKLFHFIDSDQNKVYPEQNVGDFIMFSPWALHGVDKVKTDGVNRTIVSGNIICNRYKELDHDPLSFVCRQKIVQGKPQLVWTREPNHG